MSRLQEFCQSIPLFNLNLEGLQPQLGERRQIHLHEHQLPTELKELVKTDNVEGIHLVQATIRVSAHFVVKFKSNCNYDKFTKYEFFFIERGVDLPVEPKLVFDDTCEEIFNEKDFVKLATAGRHKNVYVIYVKHNLFQQSKQSRTIDLNTTHLILFKSPRDTQKIDYLGRQLNNAKFLRPAYQLATKEDFGHLLIDLDTKTSECLRYLSNIVPPSPTIFYLPSSKAVITSLENERERIMYIEANAQ